MKESEVECMKKITEQMQTNDKENKIITAPFYMLTNNIAVIYKEAYKVIEEAIKLS